LIGAFRQFEVLAKEKISAERTGGLNRFSVGGSKLKKVNCGHLPTLAGAIITLTVLLAGPRSGPTVSCGNEQVFFVGLRFSANVSL